MGLALCRAARLENARSQVLINRSSNFHGIITSAGSAILACCVVRAPFV